VTDRDGMYVHVTASGAMYFATIRFGASGKMTRIVTSAHMTSAVH
jgi:hypothetical protein